MRLRNPLTLAQLLLDRDKGEDALDAAWLSKSGSLNNDVVLDRPIPIHIGYFTVWVKDDVRSTTSTILTVINSVSHSRLIRIGRTSTSKKPSLNLRPVI